MGRLLCLLALLLSAGFGKQLEVDQFQASVPNVPGFVEATQTTVISFLKEEKLFAAGGSTLILRAKLVAFRPGNRAVRATIGLGAGRASATYEFKVDEPAARRTVWTRTIKTNAPFFGSAPHSYGQRQQLPEEISKKLMKELRKLLAD